MNNKKIVLSAFLIIAIIQVIVPAKMIFDKETVLDRGTEYKFKVAPIDPYDPFRGKYITLSFIENTVEFPDPDLLTRGETIYLILNTDSNGFAKPVSATISKPSNQKNFLKVKVSSRFSRGSTTVSIDYPFDRYYMDEFKATGAEEVYRRSTPDKTKETFALVSIKDGEAVLKDVLIDGIPIREIVKNQQENKD